jgi:ferredoxin
MKKVWIDDECIACGTCVDICPEVFEMGDDVAIVRADADLTRDDGITESAEACPVEAIHFEA